MHMPAGALKQDEMLPRRRMENNPHSREHHGSHLEENAQVRCFRRTHPHPPEGRSSESDDCRGARVVRLRVVRLRVVRLRVVRLCLWRTHLKSDPAGRDA